MLRLSYFEAKTIILQSLLLMSIFYYLLLNIAIVFHNDFDA